MRLFHRLVLNSIYVLRLLHAFIRRFDLVHLLVVIGQLFDLLQIVVVGSLWPSVIVSCSQEYWLLDELRKRDLRRTLNFLDTLMILIKVVEIRNINTSAKLDKRRLLSWLNSSIFQIGRTLLFVGLFLALLFFGVHHFVVMDKPIIRILRHQLLHLLLIFFLAYQHLLDHLGLFAILFARANLPGYQLLAQFFTLLVNFRTPLGNLEVFLGVLLIIWWCLGLALASQGFLVDVLRAFEAWCAAAVSTRPQFPLVGQIKRVFIQVCRLKTSFGPEILNNRTWWLLSPISFQFLKADFEGLLVNLLAYFRADCVNMVLPILYLLLRFLF